jgi:5'-nucleotidase
MKSVLITLTILLLLSGSGMAQTDTLTILFASDTHSNLAPIGERSADCKGTLGGIARAATLIGMTKMTEPNVLTLHSGDLFIGDIFYNATFGIAELQMMKLIGYDVMTLGNHEFDLGPAMLEMALDSSMNESPMSIVSSNIMIPDTNTLHLKKYIVQCTIRQFNNVKIGIFGLTTPGTNYLSQPSPVSFDENIPECAMKTVDSLKQLGCSVIICLSHLGMNIDSVLASAIPGIDLIIGSHDHLTKTAKSFTNPSGKTTWIAQANAFYTEMGKIQLGISSTETRLISSVTIALDGNIPEEPTVAHEVDKLIAGIEQQFGPMFTKQIGYASGFFGEVAEHPAGSESKETAIGNLVTDAFREYTKTDIAIEPGGSTAQPLYKGPIVGDDLFRVVGYGFNEKDYLGFRLVTFSITGESLFVVLEKCLANIDVNDEFFPQVSGMKYSYNPEHAPGSRINWILVNDQPLDPVKRYSVTTNELALTLLTTFLEINVSNIAVLDTVSEYQALADYVSRHSTISPSAGGRISRVAVKTSGILSPNHFSLGQNFPNPFNPATTISFELPVQSHATLKVYDILGKEVATLVDENLPAGSYNAVFNAQQCASGIYFYRLTTENFCQTKKMSLLR